MNAWSLATVLLADSTRWKSMGSGLKGNRARLDSGDLMIGLLVAVVVIAGLVILSRHVSQSDRRRTQNSPGTLFRALCKAHGLDWSTRRLLRQVARCHQLEHPALLFVEPHRYDESQLSPALRSKRAQLTSLRDNLFAARFDEADDNA